MIEIKDPGDLIKGNTFTFDIKLKGRKLFTFVEYESIQSLIKCIDNKTNKPCSFFIKNKKFVFVLKK